MEKPTEAVLDGLARVLFAAKEALERQMPRYSLVGDQSFFEPAAFRWVAEVERSLPSIRAELAGVLEHRAAIPNFQDISPEQECITNDDRWKTFFLYGYGVRADANCERCPATAAALERIPGMVTGFFSILGPHKHIPPHTGPYKGVLRYHLAVVVPGPPGACRIRVGTDVRPWQDGMSLIFDDTVEHEAWNDSDGERVVLFVDVIRPLRQPLAVLNRTMIKLIALSPMVRTAHRNLQLWEERLAGLERRRGTAPRPERVGT